MFFTEGISLSVGSVVSILWIGYYKEIILQYS